MKRLFKKEQKIDKGMPSAVVLSILIHGALFLLAGMFVVFTVVKKEDVKFVPPKAVERPKIKLRKPKVKVRKSANPKPTTRIVTKVTRASMPDIQLPEMSGIMGDFSGGFDGFDLAIDFEEVSVFGGGQAIGNDFVGTFYDLKRDRRGRTIPMDPDALRQALREFVRSGWKPSKLGRYYSSPKKLYTTCFAVPEVSSALAPSAFGEEDTRGWCWAAHYKGQLVHPEGITFRFWGMGDDLMVVRVNGELVLVSSWPGGSTESYFERMWSSTSPDTLRYPLGINLSVVGDWITLEPGVPLNMEVLISEVFGGAFQAMLVVEVKGEEYPKNPFRGGPTLPIFKTADIPLDLVEAIYGNLDPGDASVTNGPIFRDYTPPVREIVKNNKTDVAGIAGEAESTLDDSEMRLWTSTDGRTVEAELVTVMGDKVVLKNIKGKQNKIPLSQLSAEDMVFIELAIPPVFDISFSKKSAQVTPPSQSPFSGALPPPMQIFDYRFGVKLKRKSARTYTHELHVEYFAFAEEVDGDNYVLLDRQEYVFTPSENKGVFSFENEGLIRIQSIAMRDASPMRGTKYGGFLVIITDERGKIIQYETSHQWLFENRANLQMLPLGKHFNKMCVRVSPPRPGPKNRHSWYFL